MSRLLTRITQFGGSECSKEDTGTSGLRKAVLLPLTPGNALLLPPDQGSVSYDQAC